MKKTRRAHLLVAMVGRSPIRIDEDRTCVIESVHGTSTGMHDDVRGGSRTMGPPRRRTQAPPPATQRRLVDPPVHREEEPARTTLRVSEGRPPGSTAPTPRRHASERWADRRRTSTRTRVADESAHTAHRQGQPLSAPARSVPRPDLTVSLQPSKKHAGSPMTRWHFVDDWLQDRPDTFQLAHGGVVISSDGPAQPPCLD